MRYVAPRDLVKYIRDVEAAMSDGIDTVPRSGIPAMPRADALVATGDPQAVR